MKGPRRRMAYEIVERIRDLEEDLGSGEPAAVRAAGRSLAMLYRLVRDDQHREMYPVEVEGFRSATPESAALRTRRQLQRLNRRAREVATDESDLAVRAALLDALTQAGNYVRLGPVIQAAMRMKMGAALEADALVLNGASTSDLRTAENLVAQLDRTQMEQSIGLYTRQRGAHVARTRFTTRVPTQAALIQPVSDEDLIEAAVAWVRKRGAPKGKRPTGGSGVSKYEAVANLMKKMGIQVSARTIEHTAEALAERKYPR